MLILLSLESFPVVNLVTLWSRCTLAEAEDRKITMWADADIQARIELVEAAEWHFAVPDDGYLKLSIGEDPAVGTLPAASRRRKPAG